MCGVSAGTVKLVRDDVSRQQEFVSNLSSCVCGRRGSGYVGCCSSAREGNQNSKAAKTM